MMLAKKFRSFKCYLFSIERKLNLSEIGLIFGLKLKLKKMKRCLILLKNNILFKKLKF